MILSRAAQAVSPKDENIDSDSGDENRGNLIVDATCALSQIKFPRDTGLLNDARKTTEKLIDLWFIRLKRTFPKKRR